MKRASLDRLTRILELSIELVRMISEEKVAVADVARTMDLRQDIVDLLGDTVEDVTPGHRRIVDEIAQLDAQIMVWCQARQSHISSRIISRPRRPTQPSTQPRIICHVA